MMGEYKVLLIRTSGLSNRLPKGKLTFNHSDPVVHPGPTCRLPLVKRFNDQYCF